MAEGAALLVDHVLPAQTRSATLLGARSSALVSTLNARGTVHDQRGETDAALADYARALAICEAHLGPDHPDVAGSSQHGDPRAEP